MRLRVIVLGCVSALLPLGACIHAGPASDPVSRNLSWFDYVVAEGLHGVCAPRTHTQLRPIYNGTSNKQAQIYNLLAPSSGRGASIPVWARGTGDLTQGVQVSNILSPWQGKRVESVLDPEAMMNLVKAFDGHSFVAFTTVGLRQPSNKFFWAVAGRMSGRVHADAWMYPSDRFKALRLPALLIANGRGAAAFRKATPVSQRNADPA